MSWNRNKYDQCAYQKDLSQSTSSINYALDPNKFYNCNDCRVEFGLLGGNNVSITQSNMVDLESDLFNIIRQNSTCPERKYLPHCESCDDNDGIPCGSLSCKRREQLKHLGGCNMVQYGPRIDHIGFELRYPGCPVQNTKAIDGQQMVYPPQLNPVQWKGQDNQFWQDQPELIQEYSNFNTKQPKQTRQPSPNKMVRQPRMVSR